MKPIEVPNLNICSCSLTFQKAIYPVLAEVNGAVETLYIQSSKDGQVENEAGGESGNAVPHHHRYVLTCVVPCSHQDSSLCHHPGEAHSSAIVNLAKRDMDSNSSDFSEVASLSKVLTSLDTGRRLHIQSAEDNVPEDDESLAVSDLDLSELRDFSLSINERDEDYGNVSLLPSPVTLFPLSDEELHAAIHEGLNKNSEENSKLGSWTSSLFNDVAEGVETQELLAIKSEKPDEIQHTLSSTSLPQINGEESQHKAGTVECSSSSSPSQVSTDSASPPESVPCQQYYQLADFIQAAPAPTVYTSVPSDQPNHLEYAIQQSSEHQQIFCPANLPAVSALVNGNGQAINWTLSRATTTQAKATLIRLAKPVNTTKLAFISSSQNAFMPGASNITQFVTKPSSTLTKVRARKTPPCVVGDAPKKVKEVLEKLPAFALPPGHTYESWILQEGLYKVRKLRLHNPNPEECPFACPICDKKYKNANGIKYHAKYAHGPKKIFTCESCPRTYATRHGLSAHKRSHTVTEAASAKESGNCEQLSPVSENGQK